MAVALAVSVVSEPRRPTRNISANNRRCRRTPANAGTKPSLPRHKTRPSSSTMAPVVTMLAIASPTRPSPGHGPMPNARMPASGT